MNFEIIKIHPPKRTARGKNVFIRVEFKDQAKQWYKTDLCPDYRNWNRWRSFLKVGVLLKNLQLLDQNSVDADSFPQVAGIAGEEFFPNCTGCSRKTESHQRRTKEHPI